MALGERSLHEVNSQRKRSSSSMKSLFNDTLSTALVIQRRMVRWLWMMNWEGRGTKRWWLYEGTDLEFAWRDLGKPSNIQDNRLPGRDSKPGPSEYEALDATVGGNVVSERPSRW